MRGRTRAHALTNRWCDAVDARITTSFGVSRVAHVTARDTSHKRPTFLYGTEGQRFESSRAR